MTSFTPKTILSPCLNEISRKRIRHSRSKLFCNSEQFCKIDGKTLAIGFLFSKSCRPKHSKAVVRRCSVKKGVLKNVRKIHRKTPLPEFLF